MPGPRGGSGGRAGETRRRPLHCPSLGFGDVGTMRSRPPLRARGQSFPRWPFQGSSGTELDTGLSLGFERHKWVDMTHCHIKKGLGLVAMWPPLYEQSRELGVAGGVRNSHRRGGRTHPAGAWENEAQVTGACEPRSPVDAYTPWRFLSPGQTPVSPPRAVIVRGMEGGVNRCTPACLGLPTRLIESSALNTIPLIQREKAYLWGYTKQEKTGRPHCPPCSLSPVVG